MNLAGSWQSQPGCNRIQKTAEGHEKSWQRNKAICLCIPLQWNFFFGAT